MKSVFALGQYPTSRDYELLADLAKLGGVICIVDNWQLQGCRDVAQTAFLSKNDQEHFLISGRGISYVNAFSRSEFVHACRHANVEFLAPIQAPPDECTRTAPAALWLQISDDPAHRDQVFPTGADVTWCADSATACQVQYIRADLTTVRP